MNAHQPNTPVAHGHIALFRGTSLISRAIRWQSRSVYSHAGYVLEDGSIIEAWHIGGVARNPHLGHVHTPGTQVDLFTYAPGLSDREQDDVECFLLAQVGCRYDFRSVARFMSRIPASENARWFCSELVFAAFVYAGIGLLSRIDAENVHPGHLALSPLLIHTDTRTTTE